MEIKDTFVWKPAKNTRNNYFLLPRDIRCLIIGRSHSGKTVLLSYLLLEPGILDYDTLTICGRTLHQPEYQIMRLAFSKGLSKSQIKVLFERQADVEEEGGIEKVISSYDGPCSGKIKVTFEEDPTKIPDPRSFDRSKKNTIVLDDVMLSPQSNIENYFCRGRHISLDIFYISQSYLKISRHCIRQNSNFFIFFKQCQKDLQHIYYDLCAIDGIPYEKFVNFCSYVWEESPHNFVVIDLTRPADCGKYRKCMDEYWSWKYDRIITE